MLAVDPSILGKSTRYLIAIVLIFRGLVRLISIGMRIENGISARTSIEETSIVLDDAETKDIGFQDDFNLLVLCGRKGS